MHATSKPEAPPIVVSEALKPLEARLSTRVKAYASPDLGYIWGVYYWDAPSHSWKIKTQTNGGFWFKDNGKANQFAASESKRTKVTHEVFSYLDDVTKVGDFIEKPDQGQKPWNDLWRVWRWHGDHWTQYGSPFQAKAEALKWAQEQAEQKTGLALAINKTKPLGGLDTRLPETVATSQGVPIFNHTSGKVETFNITPATTQPPKPSRAIDLKTQDL